MSVRYVLGVHIDREPHVICEKYHTPFDLGVGRIKRFTILGENCKIEKWVKTFHGYGVELPIRIPHYAPQSLIACVEGKRYCGHTAEVYRLRPLARVIGAKKAILLVYATAAWSNDKITRYLQSYIDFIVNNLQELLLVF